MKIRYFIVGFLAFTLIVPFVTKAQDTDLEVMLTSLRQQIEQLKQQIANLQTQLVTLEEAEKTLVKFTKYLHRGIAGDEVTELQEFLSQFPDIYPEGLVTGYFGPLTESAVKRWQKQQGIEQVGMVGPQTRASLNKVFSSGGGGATPATPATPSPGTGTPAIPAIPAVPAATSTTATTTPSGTVPATPAIPAIPSGGSGGATPATPAIPAVPGNSISTTTPTLEPIPGCTDETATNYSSEATEDDGSCIVPVPGCTDESAINYDPSANVDDGSCTYSETPAELGCGGITSINDSRDTNNPVYETVEIGTQCWLKRNLNVGTRVDGNADQTNNGILEKYCYYNTTESNCNIYGGLYQWNEAMQHSETEGAQGICPAGWHIPSDTEWKTLEMGLGMTQEQADIIGWRGTTEGDDLKAGGTSGFNALLGGSHFPDGHFANLGRMEGIWTSSPTSIDRTLFRYLQVDKGTIYRLLGNSEVYGHHVRCIKGEGTPTTYPAPDQEPVVSSEPIPTQISSCGGITSVTDTRDTNNPVYETVAIGNQCWLNRNINVGTRIDGVAGVLPANNGTIEKFCYGNNESYCSTHGGLYQWDEVMNYSEAEGAQGICPAGWHIPTDTEWKTLEMGLGMTQEQADIKNGNWAVWRGTVEGDRLKNVGLCGDRVPCGTSGYNDVLAGQFFQPDGHWDNLGSAETIWTSSLNGDRPWTRFLRNWSSMVLRYDGGKLYGLSARCIMD